MPVSSRRLQAPAGPHGLVLNHTVEHGSSGQCAIISGFHLSPILGKPSLAKAAATPNPHRPTPAVPRVPSSGAFGRRPPYTGRPLAPGRHPKPFTKSRGASVRSEQNLGSKRRPIAPGLFYASTCRTFVRERYELRIRPLFQGSAKMITVDDAGGVLQNLTAAPDITPRYCLPPMA
jgi:hypothetical protein